ncbi:MAG: hypothetical protein V1822_03945 [Candidatus Micrarchaeota archaeon]
MLFQAIAGLMQKKKPDSAKAADDARKVNEQLNQVPQRQQPPDIPALEIKNEKTEKGNSAKTGTTETQVSEKSMYSVLDVKGMPEYAKIPKNTFEDFTSSVLGMFSSYGQNPGAFVFGAAPQQNAVGQNAAGAQKLQTENVVAQTVSNNAVNAGVHEIASANVVANSAQQKNEGAILANNAQAVANAAAQNSVGTQVVANTAQESTDLKNGQAVANTAANKSNAIGNFVKGEEAALKKIIETGRNIFKKGVKPKTAATAAARENEIAMSPQAIATRLTNGEQEIFVAGEIAQTAQKTVQTAKNTPLQMPVAEAKLGANLQTPVAKAKLSADELAQNVKETANGIQPVIQTGKIEQVQVNPLNIEQTTAQPKNEQVEVVVKPEVVVTQLENANELSSRHDEQYLKEELGKSLEGLMHVVNDGNGIKYLDEAMGAIELAGKLEGHKRYEDAQLVADLAAQKIKEKIGQEPSFA